MAEPQGSRGTTSSAMSPLRTSTLPRGARPPQPSPSPKRGICARWGLLTGHQPTTPPGRDRGHRSFSGVAFASVLGLLLEVERFEELPHLDGFAVLVNGDLRVDPAFHLRGIDSGRDERLGVQHEHDVLVLV